MAVVGIEAALQARLIAMAGYRLIAALGSTLRWRTDGLEHLDAIARSGRQPVMAFWHGRILPATYYFRRRGIVVITSENFDGEWIAGIIERFGFGTARGSTSRGARKALLQLTREMARGAPGRLHGRRPARSGRSGAARRGLAGAGDRESGAAVSSRSRSPLVAAQLGSHADSQAVRDRRAGRRRAVRGAGRRRAMRESNARAASSNGGCTARSTRQGNDRLPALACRLWALGSGPGRPKSRARSLKSEANVTDTRNSPSDCS